MNPAFDMIISVREAVSLTDARKVGEEVSVD